MPLTNYQLQNAYEQWLFSQKVKISNAVSNSCADGFKEMPFVFCIKYKDMQPEKNI